MVQDLASQNILIGCHIFGGLSLNLVMPGSFDAARKRCGDRRCNLVLNSENVLKLSIVSFSPDVRFGLAVDKLNSDPDAIGRFAYASFHNVVDAEFPRNLLRLNRLALVYENGVARDHEQLTETRQFGNDVLSQAVREKLLLRIATHVGERQHGNRRLSNAYWRRHLPVSDLGPLRGLAAQQNPVYADRAADVLDVL